MNAQTLSPYSIPGLATHSIKKDDLPSILGVFGQHKQRKRELVIPRQIGMVLAATFFATQTEAGRLFRKDHATVIHSLNVIADAIDTNDKQVILLITPLFKKLYNQHKTQIRCWKDLSANDKLIASRTEANLDKHDYARMMVERIKSERS